MKEILHKRLDLDAMSDIDLDLSSGDIVFLYGHLGAGKTTFVRNQIQKLVGKELDVTSPTYTYYQEYDGVVHFDLYRCESYDDIIRIGADELLDRDDIIMFVEWPELLSQTHQPVYEVWLDHTGDDESREVRIVSHKSPED